MSFNGPKDKHAEAALMLAEARVPLFPCKPDKTPCVKWGEAATCDRATVQSWWEEWPDALPAVPMGAASNLFAVDADIDKSTGEAVGETTLQELGLDVARHRFAQATPSGGSHLFFSWEPDLPRNSVKHLPGIDIRSEGGYVVVYHPEALIAAHRAADLEGPPRSLLDALKAEKAKPKGDSPGSDSRYDAGDGGCAWAETALANEIAALANAEKGGRNDAVNRCAFNLGQIVGGGRLDQARVEEAIWGAAMANGVAVEEPNDTRRSMKSGLEAGMEQPRGPKYTSGAGARSSGRHGGFAKNGGRTASAAPFEHDPGKPPPHEKSDGLPDGFQLREDGVYRYEDAKNNEPGEWIKLSSPIRVVALTCDRSGEGWGRLVEITDRDGGKHLWAIPAELFAGDGLEIRRECLRLGLDITSGTKARNAFTDLLMRWQPEARAITADRLGWADETCSAFVLGDGRVIGAEQVVYQQANVPAAAAEMRVAGTSDGWREQVSTLCVGNPLMIVSVSVAFAGVLLEPLSLDGGGLHLRGASSRGKSTAQRVAVSVWGSPRLLLTWRATANGLEGVATACNSTVLALDEMGEVSGREAGAAAYMLANGAGKARADRSGRARPLYRWRVMILSSGEIGLADKVAEAGRKAAAGQMVRLLDIAADSFAHGAFAELHGAADGAAFADRAKAATAEHYGAAGPDFARLYLADPERALDAVRTLRSRFKESAAERYGLEAEGQVSRAVDRLALIAAAGEMATAWGLTGWELGAAQEAALTVLGLWLEGRGGSGPAEAREAVERTRAFIVRHGASRFEELDGDDPRDRPVINRAGWKQGELFYIPPTVWKEIHQGADAKRAALHVATAGFLDAPEQGRFTKKAPRSVPSRPNCYAVKAEILGGDDD